MSKLKQTILEELRVTVAMLPTWEQDSRNKYGRWRATVDMNDWHEFTAAMFKVFYSHEKIQLLNKLLEENDE